MFIDKQNKFNSMNSNRNEATISPPKKCMFQLLNSMSVELNMWHYMVPVVLLNMDYA